MTEKMLDPKFVEIEVLNQIANDESQPETERQLARNYQAWLYENFGKTGEQMDWETWPGVPANLESRLATVLGALE